MVLNYIERLEAYCASFETASERGQRCDGIRTGLRVGGLERLVAIAFTVSASEETILRLYYGGQNWSGMHD